MNVSSEGLVRQRQDPLRAHYRTDPADAWITDHARARHSPPDDPFHGTVVMGVTDAPMAIGIHEAVGGYHDAPNPGDILCAALATCLASTIRMVSDRAGLPVLDLHVDVTAEVDVRGALVVDRDVPVAFQRMTVRVRLIVPPGVDDASKGVLRERAAHCCVVLQTLRGGVEVEEDWVICEPDSIERRLQPWAV